MEIWKMQTFKRITGIFTTVVLVAVLLLLMLLVGMRLFGFKVYTVLSGSMETAIPVGSVVYVREVDTSEIEEGDVLTYVVGNDTVVTHRVVGFVPDEENPNLVRFRTKGDANDDEDGLLLHPNNVIGRVSFHVPLIGYVASFLQNPYGKVILILSVVVAILASYLPGLVAGALGKDGENESDGEDKPQQ